MSDAVDPAGDPALEAPPEEARALCRACYGSGEVRVKRAAVLFSTHLLGGTAVVPETCTYCLGEGWYDL
jgi:DnaJ-class molecular chaperone